MLIPPALLLLTISAWHLVIVLVIVMIFFGVGKLPEVGKALGVSLRAFKEAQKPDQIDVTPKPEELETSTEKKKERA